MVIHWATKMPTVVNSANLLGRAVRDARRRSGLNQTALGERVGLTQVTVSRIERADGGATLDTVLRLLGALGLELILQDRPEHNPPAPWEA